MGATKRFADVGAVEGARPYGRDVGVPITTTQHAGTMAPKGAVPYVSDAPYVPPTLAYNERPTCIGKRRDGQPCKAKAAASGGPLCEAHIEQG